ncbi:MAG: hypothetical protein IT236_08850 [Bacteroidia bacterium]|nr:hypothetical protein [Bacteroidia bacterium]
MKTFEELNKELTLIEYLPSEFGTMYFEPDAPRDKETIIRHLDSKLTIELLPVYLNLYDAILQWIDNNARLKEHVFMPQLIEVGKDYIIRPFYVYLVSTRRYVDDEDPIEPPDQYFDMIIVAEQELPDSPENGDIIENVLRKSLLEPSGKTYFEGDINKVVIVEPKISLEDLHQWKAKMKL